MTNLATVTNQSSAVETQTSNTPSGGVKSESAVNEVPRSYFYVFIEDTHDMYTGDDAGEPPTPTLNETVEKTVKRFAGNHPVDACIQFYSPGRTDQEMVAVDQARRFFRIRYMPAIAVSGEDLKGKFGNQPPKYSALDWLKRKKREEILYAKAERQALANFAGSGEKLYQFLSDVHVLLRDDGIGAVSKRFMRQAIEQQVGKLGRIGREVLSEGKKFI